jgi:hypothetical protein
MAITCKFSSQLILGLSYSILKGLPALSKELSTSSITYFTSNFLCSIIIGYIGYKISLIFQEDKQLILKNSLNDSIIKSNNYKEKNNRKKKYCV